LIPAAEKLSFGIQIMHEFILQVLQDHPNALNELETSIYNQPAPDWEKIADDLD